ncbi:PREDICTED: uncharacterized protein LOC108566189, partial [Nicrophorus vespilloides]|uniref:Uncharacterized protein LOC108566189 n=1 Tax=Nicrophorus vespilloides TaxID=110193 RepID=A0ABM1N3N5_NICVS
ELPEPEENADCSVESGASGGQKNLSDRIGCLEAKQKLSEAAPCVQSSVSVRSVKSDVDEKYPENWSRDSLIDLNTVVNLPPVPEDIFTCFSNKPTRTSSLSSLKGMRKVKLFLQRAANNSDDEDSSDFDEHDPVGDGEDKCTNSTKKLLLGNIKEETQQD